jgi:hypothetical protein
MAALNVVLNQATLPAELLAQMAPNDLPVDASPWPLAIGYWLVIVVASIALIALVYYRRRTKLLRAYRKYCSDIKKIDVQKQHEPLHLLLRRILQDQSHRLASLNEYEFEQRVMKTLNQTTPPSWLNAHYRNTEKPSVNWSEVNQLIRAWSKEVNR